MPPSVEEKSAAGATPAYSSPSTSPGLIDQIRSSVQSSPSGNARPVVGSHSPVGSIVCTTRGPKCPDVTEAKYRPERGSRIANSTTFPAKALAATSKGFSARASPRRTNSPFFVPTKSSVIDFLPRSKAGRGPSRSLRRGRPPARSLRRRTRSRAGVHVRARRGPSRSSVGAAAPAPAGSRGRTIPPRRPPGSRRRGPGAVSAASPSPSEPSLSGHRGSESLERHDPALRVGAARLLGAIPEPLPASMLEPDQGAVAVGFEPDLDLGWRFWPIVRLPRQDEPLRRLEHQDLGPGALHPLRVHLVDPPAHARLEHEPFERHAGRVLMVRGPRQELHRPPGIELLDEHMERAFDVTRHVDALADGLGRCAGLDHHRCSPGRRRTTRRHPRSVRSMSSRRPRCSSRPTSGCTGPIIVASFPPRRTARTRRTP